MKERERGKAERKREREDRARGEREREKEMTDMEKKTASKRGGKSYQETHTMVKAVVLQR